MNENNSIRIVENVVSKFLQRKLKDNKLEVSRIHGYKSPDIEFSGNGFRQKLEHLSNYGLNQETIINLFRDVVRNKATIQVGYQYHIKIK